MDINTQTFRESYTDYYNQKILANENADENDWRSMSDKQWDKMLDGIDDYVDDFKENLKRLKEMQDKAADRAAADARSDMRANAAASAALRTAAYGFVSQTVTGDDANMKFSSDKQFWVDFLAGNIDVDKIVKEYSGD